MMWSSSVVVNVVSTVKVNDQDHLCPPRFIFLTTWQARKGLTGRNLKMNVLDRFKASLQVVWTCIFCYSTLSLLG